MRQKSELAPRRAQVLVACLAAPFVGSALLSACTPSGERDGFEGTLVAYTARFDEGTSETTYALRTGDEERPLVFSETPATELGGTVRVWGVSTDDGIQVERLELVAPAAKLGRARQSLIGAEAFEPRRFALALVDIGGGVNITADQARNTIFSTTAGQGSVRNYFREVSYGRQDIDGDVFGPFNFAMNGCDTRGMVNAIRPQITGQYDHYLWYLGSRTQQCGWAGLGEVGTPDQPANDTWYNASFGCVVLVQEPGHNLGGQHSSHIDCGNQIFVDAPDGVCTHSEYGDPYDPLGGGCDHTNVYQKAYQEWLLACNGVRTNSSGRFTIFPVEKACNGVQALQIPMPKARPFTRSGGGGNPTVESLEYYYLELRTARGFDADMQRVPTVLVHVAENWRDPNLGGRHTWILDMNPATNPMDGMTAGQAFTDPAGGVRFEVVELSQDKAVIQVDIENGTGAPTCLDGRPMLVPGPATCEEQPNREVVVGPNPAGGGNNSVAVVSFTLLDADTDQGLFEITDGMVLNLDILPENLNIRADTVPPQVGSVGYEYDGDLGRTENTAPYSLGGDDGTGDFAAMDLPLGEHVVTGTAYEGTNRSGVRGGAHTVRFTVARLGDVQPPAPDAGGGGNTDNPNTGIDLGGMPIGDSTNTPIIDAGPPMPTDVPPMDETPMVDIGGPMVAPTDPGPLSSASDKGGCAIAAGASSQSTSLFAWGSLLAGALFYGRRRRQLGGRAAR